MARVRAICFDWGGTLMREDDGPPDVPMGALPQVRCIDGALEAVEELARTRTLCVATNASVSSRALIERALGRVGLLRHFTEIFCFTELGLRKEDPRFWRAVTDRLGLPPAAIAMVGDTWEPDVVAPASAGLQAIWFNPARQEAPDPRVAQIAHLGELVSLFDLQERDDAGAS